jgi:hypothetical protein
VCLDLDAVEMCELSLVERARAYVQLLLLRKNTVSKIKHGTTRHHSMSLLPTKKVMQEYCKQQGILQVGELNIPQAKDRLAVEIYIWAIANRHKVT